MALITKADFKTEVDTMATALTTAWKDTVDTRLNGNIYHPTHPLRQLNKLFLFNEDTGVVTKNTAYIDEAFNNNKTLPVGDPFALMAMPLAALSSATVENGAKKDVVLTYDMVLDNTMAVAELKLLYTVGGNSDPVKAIVSAAFSTTKVTITVDTDYVAGKTITVSYLGTGAFEVTADIIGSPVAALAAQAVVNNV